jgi:hypothetical protein
MNKRTILIIGVAVVVVALLAGGAFMAMRLLNVKAMTGGGPGGMALTVGGKGGGGGASVFFKQIPAPELPTQTPDLRGQVASVKDNSIYVAQEDMESGVILLKLNGSAKLRCRALVVPLEHQDLAIFPVEPGVITVDGDRSLQLRDRITEHRLLRVGIRKPEAAEGVAGVEVHRETKLDNRVGISLLAEMDETHCQADFGVLWR